MIYLDNGATSLIKPKAVIDAVCDALTHLGNAGRGATDESLESSRIVFEARHRLNELINGESPAQIAFTSNATESLNIAIKGLFNPGDHIITTMMEHNSVLRPIYELVDQGASETIIPTDSKGRLNLNDIKEAVQSNTKGIVITHASNLTGNVNPIKEVAQIAAQHNLILIVDASQTMGAVPIDVQAMGIDVLCFTGHKSLLGPQGTGGLYVRPGLQIRPLKTGGTGVDTYNHKHPDKMPTALEAGTLNGHGIAGLNAALGYLLDYGIEQIEQEERELLLYFYEAVKEIPNIIIYGDIEAKPHCPTLSLNIGDLDSSYVADLLIEDYEIATRAGGHCAPLMHEALGTVEQGAVRFSLGHYTNKTELDAAIKALREISASYSE